jgi:hypothetical protein
MPVYPQAQASKFILAREVIRAEGERMGRQEVENSSASKLGLRKRLQTLQIRLSQSLAQYESNNRSSRLGPAPGIGRARCCP